MSEVNKTTSNSRILKLKLSSRSLKMTTAQLTSPNSSSTSSDNLTCLIGRMRTTVAVTQQRLQLTVTCYMQWSTYKFVHRALISFCFLFQLYELDSDPKRKEFLDDLFTFMQKRGKNSLQKLYKLLYSAAAAHLHSP